MNHIALYRMYRSQSFDELVGQEHITKTLQNSLREGRVSHAYLFSGPRGTGKTSAAKILAKAVNCERHTSGEPCNECESCRRITEGAVMDVIELDAASNNGVDEIRDIRDKVKYAPTEVRRKVYIIDEVHMLSIGASNALLKTLEEPPAHVMFILATTEPHKLPVTIVSRCQRFDFRRIAAKTQVERLRHICEREQIAADEDALFMIARLSDGGMRDALSLLDQVVSFTGKHITTNGVLSVTGGMATDQLMQLIQAIAANDLGRALEHIHAFMLEGKSADRCMEHLLEHFRDLLLLKLAPHSTEIQERVADDGTLAAAAEGFTIERLFHMIDTLNHYQSEMKFAVQPQTILEVAVMKLCVDAVSTASADAKTEMKAEASLPGQTAALQELTRKVQLLEQRLEQQPKPQSVAPPPQVSPRSQAQPLKKSAATEAFLSAKDSQQTSEILAKWGQVLSRVKEQKIMIHAWLVDGEPVSATDDQVLVAFKNTIHRETTQKPANRKFIEQVMSEVFGRPLILETMLLSEWTEALEGSGGNSSEPEILQLEPEEETKALHKEDWINQAIELFGEELVTIKED